MTLDCPACRRRSSLSPFGRCRVCGAAIAVTEGGAFLRRDWGRPLLLAGLVAVASGAVLGIWEPWPSWHTVPLLLFAGGVIASWVGWAPGLRGDRRAPGWLDVPAVLAFALPPTLVLGPGLLAVLSREQLRGIEGAVRLPPALAVPLSVGIGFCALGAAVRLARAYRGWTVVGPEEGGEADPRGGGPTPEDGDRGPA